ncbi:MAG: hypothetical protein AAGB12_08695 [Pseudomonadota bacterium]
MWSKTLVGFVVSLMLNTSLIFNIDNLIPMPTQIFLLFGFIGGFILWVLIMTYFYCVPSIKKPMIILTPILLISVAINVFFYGGATA